MRFTLFLALVAGSAALDIPLPVLPFNLQNLENIPEWALELTGDALIEYTNSVQKLWKAVVSTKPRRPVIDLKNILLPDNVTYSTGAVAPRIPASFDARENWPNCTSIGAIRDQANCGSCWAFAAAEAMSDRICIQTQGATQVTLSADDVLSCCGWVCGSGCGGGYPIAAWNWWVSNGLVTGGGYFEQSFCKPYPIAPCGTHTDANGQTHTVTNCGSGEAATPQCYKSCTNKNYQTPYAEDKYKGKTAYAVPQNINAIKTEILTHGPVEAAFTVYEDFYQYGSGVYKHVSGGVVGGHAVKIIGWGTESGTPYWLAANSWDSDWGEQGFFRIIQGTNECGIEAAIVAGIADV